MDVVLDTNALNHLTRGGSEGPDDLTKLVEKREVRIVVDSQLALVDEWRRTANSEAVQALVIKWEQHRGFLALRTERKVPQNHIKALRQLGFDDTVDKLVVRIAYSTTDGQILSSDSDFWDPTEKYHVGDDRAPVMLFLRDELKISVETLGEFIERMSALLR